MQEYRYSFLTHQGYYKNDHHFFDSNQEFFNFVEQNGYTLVSYKIYCIKQNIFFKSNVQNELKEFCFYMIHLDKSKIPLVDSIKLLATFFTGLNTSLNSVLYQINKGNLFSESLKMFPKVFDPVFIELMTTAESAGSFSAYFEKAYTYFVWKDQMTKSLRHNMVYPFILIVFVCFLFYFITYYLLPEFASFYTDVHNRELPFMTRSLIIFTSIVRFFLLPFLLCSSCFFVFLIVFSRYSFSVVLWRDFIALHIPWIGSCYRDFFTSMYLKTISVLLQEKVPFLSVLQKASEAVPNSYLSSKYKRISDSMRKGSLFSDALEETRVFSRFLVNVVRMAEDKGILNKTLEHVSITMAALVQNRIQFMMKILEPALLIFIGFMILWIVLAIWVPMYESFI